MQILKENTTLNSIRFYRSLQHYLLPLVTGLLALKSLLFFLQAWRSVVYPFEWSTMDGYYVFHGLRLLYGKPIYFGYDSLLMPFEYVPLYPAAVGLLAKIFGNGVWYERTFSVLCAAGIAAIIVRAVSALSSNRWAAACAGLLFFAPASLSVWFIVRGIDLFTAFLSIAAVMVAARAAGRKSRLFLSAAIFAFAFFSKQTAIFPMAGVVAYYVFGRRWKDTVITLGGFASLSLLMFLSLEFFTGGWFFENAFLMTSNNPFYLRLFLSLFFQFLFATVFLFPLALYQAVKKIRTSSGIWSFYFFSTCASLLLAAKAGAALSYFIPAFSAMCILCGLWLSDENFKESHRARNVVVLVLVLFQAFWFFKDAIGAPSPRDYREAARLDTLIKGRPGPLLMERLDSFATRNGRELNIEAVQLPILIMHRKYDPKTLIESLGERRFSLVIYSGIYFGGIPSVKKAIFENYHVIDEVEMGLFYGRTKFLVLAPIE